MTKLLLDSNILIWWAGGNKLLPETRQIIAEPTTEVFVSAVSIWELGIKRSIRKLDTPDDYLGLLEDNRFTHLPVTIDHALAAYSLPPIHKDPFDRMLVAQTMIEKATLITGDKKLEEYGIPLILV